MIPHAFSSSLMTGGYWVRQGPKAHWLVTCSVLKKIKMENHWRKKHAVNCWPQHTPTSTHAHTTRLHDNTSAETHKPKRTCGQKSTLKGTQNGESSGKMESKPSGTSLQVCQDVCNQKEKMLCGYGERGHLHFFGGKDTGIDLENSKKVSLKYWN